MRWLSASGPVLYAEKEQADGTIIAYENSADVQMKRLDKRMKDEELQKKLNSLKAAKKK